MNRLSKSALWKATLDSFSFQILEGRFFQPGSNEAIAGKGLLEWLGLQYRRYD